MINVSMHIPQVSKYDFTGLMSSPGALTPSCGPHKGGQGENHSGKPAQS